MDGIDVYGLSAERRADFRHEYLGFVFQQQHLVPYLTALENVMLPLADQQALRTGEQTAMAQAALERVGLGDKGHGCPASSRAGSRSGWRSPGRW